MTKILGMKKETPVVSLLAADFQGEADAHGEDQALVVVGVVAENFEPARGRACDCGWHIFKGGGPSW